MLDYFAGGQTSEDQQQQNAYTEQQQLAMAKEAQRLADEATMREKLGGDASAVVAKDRFAPRATPATTEPTIKVEPTEPLRQRPSSGGALPVLAFIAWKLFGG